MPRVGIGTRRQELREVSRRGRRGPALQQAIERVPAIVCVMSMTPCDTERLHFRPMTDDDLDRMATLLGDSEVMAYYPAPKSREQAQAWIDWNRANYAEHGYGLWIIETFGGDFVGDCGLTWQDVNGCRELEVGYHVHVELQGNGYATEAAAACRDFSRDVLAAVELVAIIHPDNAASRRVAEKIGMQFMAEEHSGAPPVRLVLGMQLAPSR